MLKISEYLSKQVEALKQAAKITKHHDQVLRGLTLMPRQSVSWDSEVYVEPKRDVFKRKTRRKHQPPFQTVSIRNPDGAGWISVRVSTLNDLAKKGLLKRTSQGKAVTWSLIS